MALSANTVWEVRNSGADTNGGGFVTGASGTDWSQQDAAQYNVTDGVTAGTSTITSATANFGTDVVGNLIYVQGGTGSITAGWYEITGRTNSTTITVDRSTGLTAGTGVTLNIGGALATITKVAALCTTDRQIGYVKATADYTLGTGISWSGGGGNSGPRLIGYTTTRGDGGRATVKATAGITMFTLGNFIMRLENFVIDGDSQSGSRGVTSNAQGQVYNCVIKNCTHGGWVGSGGGKLVRSEVTACGSTGTNGAVVLSSSDAVVDCDIHDNTTVGVYSSGVVIVTGNKIYNNTGASSDGLSFEGNGGTVERNTVYGNGRDGAIARFSYSMRCVVKNNLFVGNARYGLNGSGFGSTYVIPDWSHNAYYNNTSGARNNLSAGEDDVTLTADPFTDAAGDDFTLNNTAGGGAACRAAGYPAYLDIGALQHQEISGGGMLRALSLSGGLI